MYRFREYYFPINFLYNVFPLIHFHYPSTDLALLFSNQSYSYISPLPCPGMEAYFNWRRTGYPTFYAGVGNGNSNRIALRWIYPLTERTSNPVNYKAAIDAQFAGKDDINDLIWLLK
jgi:hypothetical protein